jgi:serine protease Do
VTLLVSGCIPDMREANRGGRGVNVIVPERSVLDAQSAFQRVAELARPAVVSIRSRRLVPTELPGGMPFGQMEDLPPQVSVGTGSGFIVRPDGWIITNDHVVAGAQRVTVRLSDGREFDGEVTRDFRSDLAVIKIPAKNLATLELAEGEVTVGSWAVAYGSPFGLEETMTMGIVSAIGRTQLIGAETGMPRFFPSLLQTDASINPGNSGGPLLDISGRVIGVNVAIGSPTSGNVGIGFAIPATSARFVVEELIERGAVTRGYLGIMPAELTPQDRERYGVQDGALIVSLTDGAPADRAGLRVEDIVIAYNGRTIRSDVELRDAVARTQPGNTARMSVVRQRQRVELTARVADAPRPPDPQVEEPPAPTPLGRLGLRVVDITPEVAARIGLVARENGVLVIAVQPTGTAADANIRPGDIVIRINGQQVDSADRFNRTIQGLASGEAASFVVRRANVRVLARVRVP